VGFDVTMLRETPWSPRERAARFAEFVELTDLLLRQPVTTYRGRYYQAYEVRFQPACRQQPRVPFAVAATGPRGMRLAARHGDYWITTGAPNLFEQLRYDVALPLVRQQVGMLTRACEAVGRDSATLRRMLVTGPMIAGLLDSIEVCRDALGRYAEAGMTDIVIHWPRAQEPYRGRMDVLQALAEDVRAARAPTAAAEQRRP